HGAVVPESDRSPPARGNGCDAAPALNVALAILVPAGGDYRSVGPQAHRVGVPCMRVAHRHHNDLAPAGYVTLPGAIFAGRDHGAVPPESDGMPVARRDRAVAIETNHPLATSEAGCVPATKRVASHVPASRLPPCGKCSAPETRFPCAGNRS